MVIMDETDADNRDQIVVRRSCKKIRILRNFMRSILDFTSAIYH